MTQCRSLEGSKILFRGRRNHQLFNVDYCLWDGHQPGDLANYLVGDSVDIFFPNQKRLITKLVEFRPAEMQDAPYDDTAVVACTVVKRKHMLTWKYVGKFDEYCSVSVTLEPESDFWEEVLRMIVNKEEPHWMK